jgi:hypothetical protein
VAVLHTQLLFLDKDARSFPGPGRMDSCLADMPVLSAQGRTQQSDLAESTKSWVVDKNGDDGFWAAPCPDLR